MGATALRRGCRWASASRPRSPCSAGAGSPRGASRRGPRAHTVPLIDVETAIRTRRTHKAFEPKMISREEIDELLELAGWAPNHHLTVPWRFRVLGPASLERLKAAAGPEAAPKLDRAPTLIVSSCTLSGDAEQDEEDLHATAVASYIVLLAAHARGLAGYWRTPAVLREQAGREAVGLPEGERFVGLLHLGYPIQEQRVPERPGKTETTIYLD